MFSYSSFTISSSILINFFNTRIYNFYTDEAKLNVAYIPIVMIIYAIWNAFNDPLFGWISDRTRTKLGRRFPYIVFGFIPLTIAFAAIWLIPLKIVQDNKQVMILFYMLATLLIFDTLYTLVVLNWHSLFPEKFKTATERNYVAALRQIISLIGVAVAVVLAPRIFQYNNLESYRKAILIISSVVLFGFVISLYGCRDEPNYTEIKERTESYKKYFLEVIKNKNLIVFLIGFGLANVAYLTLLAMVPYYNKWIILQSSEFESYLYGIGIIVAGMAFFFWARISIKLGSKAVFMISSLTFSLSLLLLILKSSVTLSLITMGIAGIPLAGLLMIPEVLLSEVIDDDYEKYKKKREGIFFGFYGFSVRIAIILQSAIISLILSLTGYDANELNQTALAKTGIKILMTAVPITCFILGMGLMLFFFDLSRKRLEKETGKQRTIFF